MAKQRASTAGDVRASQRGEDAVVGQGGFGDDGDDYGDGHGDGQAGGAARVVPVGAPTRPVDALAVMPTTRRPGVLGVLSDEQRIELKERWRAWAHRGQVEPPGDWRVWMIRAGRGFGKTRAGAEWVSEMARRDRRARIALVGATVDEVRRVMIEGPSGLIAVARDGETVTFQASRGFVRFSSGACAAVFSAAAPEGLRGPEHDIAWCDELGKWPGDGAAWDNLMMGMRRGKRPRTLVTTTPRPTRLMRRIMALADLVETVGRTSDNPHLPDAYVDAMAADYAGTVLGKQEFDGEMVDAVTGALWTRAMIERARVAVVPATDRVVVGVDPPAGTLSGEGGDACGIVAVARGRDGCAYVIEDASVAATSPEAWARAVAACAARVGADRVVAEANQGGAMVGSVLRAADVGLPLTLVHAARGKVARAEPVALLYEAGRVRHAAVFADLEDELCGLAIGGGYEGPGRSPDRADALVWAVSELMLGKRARAGVRTLG
jgi:phage terminase large subunit-like protein